MPKIKQPKQKRHYTKTARNVSEKLAQPAAPIGLGAQIKLVGDAYSEVMGKRNWISRHSMDITIFIGLFWSIGKIILFFNPAHPWGQWIMTIDAFAPMCIVCIAIAYRVYPYINVFFQHDRKK